MLSVLSRLRAEHRSVDGYLEANGAAPETLAALRAGLLA
jgi:hypothetical protein